MTSHSLFISGLLAKQLTLRKPSAQAWSSPETDSLDGVQAKLGIYRVPFLRTAHRWWASIFHSLRSAVLEPTLIDGRSCLLLHEQGTGSSVSRIPWSEPLFSPKPQLPHLLQLWAPGEPGRGWASCSEAVPSVLDLAACTSRWFYWHNSPQIYPFHLGPLSPSVSVEAHKWAHPQISDRHKQNNKVKSTWWWKTQGETWSQYFRSVRFMHWTIRQVTQGGVHIFTY